MLPFTCRHDDLRELTWEKAYPDFEEFPTILLIFTLLQTLPPTSVACETSFSHMKLIKTSRRKRLRGATLDNLMMVKLEAPDIEHFNPEKAVDTWLVCILNLTTCK